jgi:hypothetical protein
LAWVMCSKILRLITSLGDTVPLAADTIFGARI